MTPANLIQFARKQWPGFEPRIVAYRRNGMLTAEYRLAEDGTYTEVPPEEWPYHQKDRIFYSGLTWASWVRPDGTVGLIDGRRHPLLFRGAVYENGTMRIDSHCRFTIEDSGAIRTTKELPPYDDTQTRP